MTVPEQWESTGFETTTPSAADEDPPLVKKDYFTGTNRNHYSSRPKAATS